MVIRKSLLFVVAVFCASPIAAGAASATEISVTGSGSVSRQPDVATVTLTLTTNDDAADAATSRNNAIYERVASSLAAIAIAKTDVRTTYFGMNFVPRPPDEAPASTGAVVRPVPQGERYGYVVTRTLEATVRDTRRVGRAIDAAVAAGATEIGGVAFGLADRRSAFSAALKRAVGDARDQGEALAAAAHLRIVRIKSIQQGFAPAPPVPMMTRAALSAPAAPTQIEPSNVGVDATVTVIFEAVP